MSEKEQHEYEIDLFLCMIHDVFCGSPHMNECSITRTMDRLSTRSWASDHLRTLAQKMEVK
jgi:hypothetical protein